MVKGWDEGMIGMKRGSKRIIAIPPQLGYGASGRSPVPPHATLVLELELIKVRRASEPPARSRTSSASASGLPPVLFPNSPAPDMGADVSADVTDDEDDDGNVGVNSSQQLRADLVQKMKNLGATATPFAGPGSGQAGKRQPQQQQQAQSYGSPQDHYMEAQQQQQPQPQYSPVPPPPILCRLTTISMYSKSCVRRLLKVQMQPQQQQMPQQQQPQSFLSQPQQPGYQQQQQQPYGGGSMQLALVAPGQPQQPYQQPGVYGQQPQPYGAPVQQPYQQQPVPQPQQPYGLQPPVAQPVVAPGTPPPPQ